MWVAALAAVAVVLSAAPNDGLSAGDIVATVNGEPVTVREFERFIFKNRARVFSHFRQEYGSGDCKDFWVTPAGGTSPIEMLREVSLKDCVRTKVQMILARDKGLIEDVSYSGFLEQLDRENRRRRAAVHNHEVIYGPVQYDESTGFAHYFSLMLIKLKARLAEEDFAITDHDLREFYESTKEEYRRPDYIRVHGLAIDFMTDRGTARGLSKRVAKATLEKLASNRTMGESLEHLSRRSGDGVRFFERVIGGNPVHDGEDDGETYTISRAAMNLAPGEVSAVFEHNGGLLFVQCIERRDMGYHEFDDRLKELLRARYIEHRYEQLVDSLVAKSKVVVNEEVYSVIQVR